MNIRPFFLSLLIATICTACGDIGDTSTTSTSAQKPAPVFTDFQSMILPTSGIRARKEDGSMQLAVMRQEFRVDGCNVNYLHNTDPVTVGKPKEGDYYYHTKLTFTFEQVSHLVFEHDKAKGYSPALVLHFKPDTVYGNVDNYTEGQYEAIFGTLYIDLKDGVTQQQAVDAYTALTQPCPK